MKRILFYLILSTIIYSCQTNFEKEIFIKSNEIGTYYNSLKKERYVLTSGKHVIPTNVTPNIYPIDYIEISRNLQITTKDNQSVTYKIDYWYKMNPNEINEFDMKIGPYYVDRFLLPKIYDVTRKSFLNIDYENIDLKEIEKIIIMNLKNDNDFTKFIGSKVIQIEERNNQKITTGNTVYNLCVNLN